VALVNAVDRQLVVALAGTVLQALSLDGRLAWALPRVPVSRLIAAGDLDGTGRGCVLVRADNRTLMLLDAATAQERWRWTVDSGTFVHDNAGVLLVPHGRGHRMVLSPTYATEILAFDLDGDGPPFLQWRIAGPWDAGFGPSVITADMDGNGTPELLLSSRIGTADRMRRGRTTTADLVLGRRRGSVYQAVHDLSTGALLDQVAFAPDARAYRCARPYGLLTAAPLNEGELPGIVLVSCQVEEYLAVTGRTASGGMRRAWGRFIEKDWPRDDRELRVHPDSLVDLDGDGRPELTVSLWDSGRWTTLVLDPAVGWAAPLATLADRVCWGSIVAADGSRELVLSVEQQRATGAPTTLELWDMRSNAVVDRLDRASVLVSEDAPLPPGVAFMARRRCGARVTWPGGGEAIVVRRWRGAQAAQASAWSVLDGQSRLETLATGAVVRVDDTSIGPLVGFGDGSIRLVQLGQRAAKERGRAIRTRGRALRTRGRAAAALVHETNGRRELVFDHADGRLVGGSFERRRTLRRGWSIAARAATMLPAVEHDADVLAAASPDVAQLVLGIHARRRVELDARLDQPPTPLPDTTLALTLRLGVHALATEIRSRTGELRARLELGAHLYPPAVLDTPDGWLLVIDDHGVIAAIGPDGHARWRRNWTAAYSMPITGPFAPYARPGVLRANGIHGVELLGATGRRLWRREAPLWTYAAGPAAIAFPADSTTAVVAMPRREGAIEALTVATGAVRWTLPLDMPIEHASVTGGDVDGDGRDEFLVGLHDGRLLCVAEIDGQPLVRWTAELPAGVHDAWLADIDGNGVGVIVASTTDGVVRVLEGGSPG
jgi:outer membrane protein assembly factor BamB